MRSVLVALLVAGALSAPQVPAAAQAAEPAPAVRNLSTPTVAGTAAYGRTLSVRPGRWTEGARLSYRWLRDGRPIGGALAGSYRVKPQDVGRRLAVRVTGSRTGHRSATVTTAPTRAVQHMVPARRVVTYSVRTKGRIKADLREFRRLAQQTFDDARGWRTSGTVFRRVRRGGDFTLSLAASRTLPSFSPVCSRQWSCRAGRNVVINQTRWLYASPAWRRSGGSLRDYRHMVVNHETGHWLGHGHRSCPRKRGPAPVMMQQSKGLGGCDFNPWPRPGERRVPRFR
ncbi:DUF3152 domain-containing protein [Aeromicrobium massiliense]|uniref:DUF3152 domain-containing protein n=1 Tax=Aeromicrobium massiliense TaxID=1464554 RepID=UPI000673F5F7|nr:DUF3152 domain-containing protein [Aeromicrobium massiliense]